MGTPKSNEKGWVKSQEMLYCKVAKSLIATRLAMGPENCACTPKYQPFNYPLNKLRSYQILFRDYRFFSMFLVSLHGCCNSGCWTLLDPV